MILLECSGTQLAECNGMKRYCGCISPAECRTRACGDEERTAGKIRLPFFWLPYFFLLCSVCGTEEGTTDWSCRTEQRERPKRDRLFARVVWNGNFQLKINNLVIVQYPILEFF